MVDVLLILHSLFVYPDKRVADWPLMHAYWPTLAITALYLMIVAIGPKLMASRQPFYLQYALSAYNLALVALNFHIFFEVGSLYHFE